MHGRTNESTSRPQAAHPTPAGPQPETPAPAHPDVATRRPTPRSTDDRFVYRLTPKALQLLREHEPGSPLAEPVARTADIDEAIEAETKRRQRSRRVREARRRGRRFGTISHRNLRGECLPLLRLSGKWLRDAGFDVGQEFEVEVGDGRLLLEVLE